MRKKLCSSSQDTVKTMDLKDFIKGTITAISESVTELNEELGESIAVSPDNINLHNEDVNSKEFSSTTKIIDGKRTHRRIVDIEFNLLVSEVASTKSGGGVKLTVIDAGINSSKEKENLNTVKFSIPVAFF